MTQTKLNWFLIGGWALDLFVGKKLREHKDIEISIWRDEAHLLFEYFKTNSVELVTGNSRYQYIKSTSEIDNRGHLIIRDIQQSNVKINLEIFITDRRDNLWIFRKQSSLRFSIEEVIFEYAQGVKYLAPHFILLYKAWFFPHLEVIIKDLPITEKNYILKCWETDCHDFQKIWPLLNLNQKKVLQHLLQTHTPGIPWLKTMACE